MEKVEIETAGLNNIAFGGEIREKEFCLRAKSVFLNNGSYGCVPRRVLDVQKRYLDEMESNPDHWFRYKVYNYWVEARESVAQFVGADVEDVVFVTNATTGVNIILHSYAFSPGDEILATSLTYGSLKYLWKDMENIICPKNVTALFMEIKIPIVSEDDLVQQYDDYLTEHPKVKIVLVDHITSPSAILMPVERLVKVCHKHGALVMVDGAHAPGQLPLNLNLLGADFYTGNLHKWTFTPRGCALLWVKQDHHGWVHPPVTSWMINDTLEKQFFSQGTRDHIPFLCAKHALHFYQAVGGMEKILAYTSQLATEGCDLLVKELRLTPLSVPISMESPNLRLLKIPLVLTGQTDIDKKEEALQIQNGIFENDDIQTVFDVVDGDLYLRISAQIYNTLDDFHRLVPVLRRLLSTHTNNCQS